MSTETDQLPRVIKFEDIREGMTIECEWESRTGDVRYRSEAVTHHLSDAALEWFTEEGALVASDNSDEVIRVLKEAPKPALPTALGTVIGGMHDDRPFVAVGWSDKGDFRGVYLDGTGTLSDLAELGPSQTFDWTVIHDPSTPKTDWQRWVDEAKRSDCGVEINGVYIQTAKRYRATEVAVHAGGGLREWIEKLVREWEANKAIKLNIGEWERGFDDALALVLSEIRTALNETDPS